MRKFIISAISLVALAAVIATPFANAATTDANGVVTVSKGDIQSAWQEQRQDASDRHGHWQSPSRHHRCSRRRPPRTGLLDGTTGTSTARRVVTDPNTGPQIDTTARPSRSTGGNLGAKRPAASTGTTTRHRTVGHVTGRPVTSCAESTAA